MTVADLLKAAQGQKLTDNVRLNVAGQSLEILDFQQGNELTIRASTPHTIAMIAAQASNQSSIASLTAAQAQAKKLVDKRVQDYVSKDLLHIPPRGPDEAAMFAKIQAGEM